MWKQRVSDTTCRHTNSIYAHRPKYRISNLAWSIALVESCPRITMECVCFCVCIVLWSGPVSCLVLSVTWRLFLSGDAIVGGYIKEEKRRFCVHLHICTYVQIGVCMFWTVNVCVDKEKILPKSSSCPAYCVFFLYFFVCLAVSCCWKWEGRWYNPSVSLQPTGTLLLARAGEQTHKHAQTQTNKQTNTPSNQPWNHNVRCVNLSR